MKSYFISLVFMLSGALKLDEAWWGMTDFASSDNKMLTFFNLLLSELILFSFSSISPLSAFCSYNYLIISMSTLVSRIC